MLLNKLHIMSTRIQLGMILLGHIFVLLLRVFGPFCVLKTVFKVFSVTISNQGRWSYALVAFDAGRAADVYFAVEALFGIAFSLPPKLEGQ